MPAAIKYEWHGVKRSYLRWTTSWAYGLHCCRHVYVVQSAHNGALLNGRDSRTISPDALMDGVWLCFHLHPLEKLWPFRIGSEVPIGGRPVVICGSDEMHNTCRSVLTILIVHLLVKRHNSPRSRCAHLIPLWFKRTQPCNKCNVWYWPVVEKCAFTSAAKTLTLYFMHHLRQRMNIYQSYKFDLLNMIIRFLFFHGYFWPW